MTSEFSPTNEIPLTEDDDAYDETEDENEARIRRGIGFIRNAMAAQPGNPPLPSAGRPQPENRSWRQRRRAPKVRPPAVRIALADNLPYKSEIGAITPPAAATRSRILRPAGRLESGADH